MLRDKNGREIKFGDVLKVTAEILGGGKTKKFCWYELVILREGYLCSVHIPEIARSGLSAKVNLLHEVDAERSEIIDSLEEEGGNTFRSRPRVQIK